MLKAAMNIVSGSLPGVWRPSASCFSKPGLMPCGSSLHPILWLPLLPVLLLGCDLSPTSSASTVAADSPSGHLARARPRTPTDPEEPAEPVGPTPRPLLPATEERWANYLEPEAGSVLDLQPFRRDQQSTVTLPDGTSVEALLVNPAPAFGVWYVLYLGQGSSRLAYHLELPDGERHTLRFSAESPTGLAIKGPHPRVCPLWAGADPSPLEEARAGASAYVPLCGGRIYLRNPVEGHKTTLEWTADFLRDHVWGGEELTTFVKDTFFQDAHLSSAELNKGSEVVARVNGAPVAPLVDPAVVGQELVGADLGLSMEGVKGQRMHVGQWYPASGNPGVYVSTLQARLVAPEVAESQRGKVIALDDVESRAMTFQVAFSNGGTPRGCPFTRRAHLKRSEGVCPSRL